MIMTTTTTDAVKGAEGWELKQLLTLYWCSEHGVTWERRVLERRVL